MRATGAAESFTAPRGTDSVGTNDAQRPIPAASTQTSSVFERIDAGRSAFSVRTPSASNDTSRRPSAPVAPGTPAMVAPSSGCPVDAVRHGDRGGLARLDTRAGPSSFSSGLPKESNVNSSSSPAVTRCWQPPTLGNW